MAQEKDSRINARPRDDTIAGTGPGIPDDALAPGEEQRGPVWWSDGAPDLNGHMTAKTPYASWFEGLPDREDEASTRDG